jgi:hypothetical protein
MSTPTPVEPPATFRFADADGDLLVIGRAAFPASGTPSVSVYTPEGGPVHVPVEQVPDVIVALGQFAGITPAPAAPADVTVFELRAGTDAEPDHVATYAVEEAATAHGEHAYQAAHGTAAYLEWRPIGAETEPSYRLVAVDDLDGEETDTDWHIVPVVVPSVYTPVGGAR